MTSNILAISGSLRFRSANTETLRAAAMVAPPSITVTLFDGLASLPHFNPDFDVEGAVLPELVQRLRSMIGGADALLISSPEYAHGVPGSLKNLLDWLVSAPETVFKPIGLLNVSPRSTHAYISLAETLRTMSTVLVPTACVEIPIAGSGGDAVALAGDPEIAARLRSVLTALAAAP